MVTAERKILTAKKPFEYTPLSGASNEESASSYQTQYLGYITYMTQDAIKNVKEAPAWQELNAKMTEQKADYFTKKNGLLGETEQGLKQNLPGFLFRGLKQLRRMKNNFIAMHDTPSGHGLKIALGQE